MHECCQDEICNSKNRCEKRKGAEDSSQPWHVVIVVVAVIVVLGASIAVYWRCRRRLGNTAVEVNGSLGNTHDHGAYIITSPKTRRPGYWL